MDECHRTILCKALIGPYTQSDTTTSDAAAGHTYTKCARLRQVCIHERTPITPYVSWACIAVTRTGSVHRSNSVRQVCVLTPPSRRASREVQKVHTHTTLTFMFIMLLRRPP